MDWRNDPVTLSMFYHRSPKIWGSFWLEYRDSYFAYSSLPPLFCLLNNNPVAFLRYIPAKYPEVDPNRTVDVSLNVSPEMRGKGIGRQTLELGSLYLASVGNIETIFAEIRAHNTDSIRTFKSAGYHYKDRIERVVEDTGEICPIERYVCYL